MTWPSFVQSFATSIVGMFSKKDKAFNPSASEGLTLYPAVRHFLWSLKLHASRDHHVRSVAYSLFCLLDLLDLLHQSMRRAIESAALERLTRVHLEAFISAHGKQNTLPKHHFTRHLSDCFAKQRWLLNCFCLERKHKAIKRYANNLHTITSHWSKTVLQDAVLTDLQGLEETGCLDRTAHVMGPLKNAPEEIIRAFSEDFGGVNAGSLKTGNVAVVAMGTCKRGDTICFDVDGSSCFGEVMLHTSLDDHAWTIVQSFSKTERENEFHRCGPLRWIETTKIKGAMIYQNLPHQKVLLIPQSF